MATTLTQFRTRVRERANMEGSQFVTDVELTGYINSSASELYDLLVSRFADYYLSDTAVTVTTGSSIPLPVNFYKLRGLDLDLGGGDYQTLRQFNFSERNKATDDLRLLRRGVSQLRYRVQGNTISLTPADQATNSYRVWFVPLMPLLVADADSFDGVNGWEEYVAVDAAIKCLQKEESSTTDLERQKGALVKRIEAMAADRDAGEPQRLTGPSAYLDRGW